MYMAENQFTMPMSNDFQGIPCSAWEQSFWGFLFHKDMKLPQQKSEGAAL